MIEEQEYLLLKALDEPRSDKDIQDLMRVTRRSREETERQLKYLKERGLVEDNVGAFSHVGVELTYLGKKELAAYEKEKSKSLPEKMKDAITKDAELNLGPYRKKLG